MGINAVLYVIVLLNINSYDVFLWTNESYFAMIILYKIIFQHTIRVPALLELI